jgi:hypothetical protein
MNGLSDLRSLVAITTETMRLATVLSAGDGRVKVTFATGGRKTLYGQGYDAGDQVLVKGDQVMAKARLQRRKVWVR